MTEDIAITNSLDGAAQTEPHAAPECEVSATTPSKRKSPIERFFSSRLYALILASLVLVGHITGLEFYLNIPFILLSSLALFTCRSIKPFIPTMLTFVYQVTLAHVPGYPTWSNYYAEPERIFIVLILVVILVIAIIYYFIKNVLFHISPKTSPLFYPIILLTLAFMTNGLLSDSWQSMDLIFGIAESLIFFPLFYMIYYGLKEERSEDILSYMSYVAALVSIILISELIFFYTNIPFEELLDRHGAIRKDVISLGWGGANPAGYALVVLVPFLIRGAMRSRASILYFAILVLTFVAALFTCARNALFFGAIAAAVLVLIGCVYGKRKRMFTNLVSAGLVSVFLGCFIFVDKLEGLINYFKIIGLSDRGRNLLWEQALTYFNESPLFGVGFFGYIVENLSATAAFIPDMAHNTPLQLLMAMGLFGFFAYFVYRIHSLKPFIVRPSIDKLVLFMVIFITLATSIFDNFIFYFHTAFPYIISLALAYRLCDEDKEKREERRAAKQMKKAKTKAAKAGTGAESDDQIEAEACDSTEANTEPHPCDNTDTEASPILADEQAIGTQRAEHGIETLA